MYNRIKNRNLYWKYVKKSNACVLINFPDTLKQIINAYGKLTRSTIRTNRFTVHLFDTRRLLSAARYGAKKGLFQ